VDFLDARKSEEEKLSRKPPDGARGEARSRMTPISLTRPTQPDLKAYERFLLDVGRGMGLIYVHTPPGLISEGVSL